MPGIKLMIKGYELLGQGFNNTLRKFGYPRNGIHSGLEEQGLRVGEQLESRVDGDGSQVRGSVEDQTEILVVLEGHSN